MAEEKQKKKGKLGLLLAMVGVLAVVAAVCIVLLCKKDEVYRNIRITELVGEAVIQRGDIKDLKADKNTNLQSGDVLLTSEGAKVTLCLDDDKYVVVDENSKLLLLAEGTEEDSKTRLELEYGAVFSDIKKKLSENSEFEVVAPSSVMSVRGTQFEVVYRELKDESGKIVEKVMKVLTFEGEVYVKPEGSKDKRVSKAGTMEVLTETAEGTYGFAAETKEIEAEDLSELSATYLKEDLSKDGENLSEEEKALKENLLKKVEKFFEKGTFEEGSFNPANHLYSFVTLDGRDWKEILAYCEAHGGHLATIHSEEENVYLYERMLEWDFSYAYFGLTDEETEGEWKWVTGDAVTYTNWNEDDVDNWSEEDYAMLWTRRPYYWNDGGLRESSRDACFIIEWEVNGTGNVVTPEVKPTSTPIPTPTPTPEPEQTKPTGTLRLQVYLPKVMQLPMSELKVEGMNGLYEALQPYEKSVSSANLTIETSFEDPMNVILNDIAEQYVQGECEIKEAAEAFYGREVVVLCNGFYSENDYEKLYGLEEHCSFAEFGVTSSYLTLYPVYTVYVPELNISHRYQPVRLMTEEKIAETGDEENRFYTFMVQSGTTIGLPTVEGYDMCWMGRLNPTAEREQTLMENQLSWPILSGEKQGSATDVASGTFRIQITVPQFVKEAKAPVLSDMDALISALAPYRSLDNSFVMTDVYTGDQIAPWLDQLNGAYVANRSGYLQKIEAAYGESPVMQNDGYYDYSGEMLYVTGDRHTFASYGVADGDLRELYPCFSLQLVSGGEVVSYAPCTLQLEVDGGADYFGMMLPTNAGLELPVVDGYVLYWKVDGERVSEAFVVPNTYNKLILCAERQ